MCCSSRPRPHPRGPAPHPRGPAPQYRGPAPRRQLPGDVSGCCGSSRECARVRMPARPFLPSGGQGLESSSQRVLTLCLCGGPGTSLRAEPRRRCSGQPRTCTLRSAAGLSPVLLCGEHLGGSVEWQEHPGRSTGGDGACWGQCWRSAGRPAWDLLEQSASHSPAEVAALRRPRGSARPVLLPGVAPASSRALAVSS